MKTHLISTGLRSLFLCSVFLLSCHHETVQEYTVQLSYSDGTKESYTLFPGSLIFVNNGPNNMVAKAVSGSDDALELQVESYAIAQDTTMRERRIQKIGGSTNRIALKKSTLLAQGANIQVELQSINTIDTGTGPVGACKGNCCEAKCYSTFCCADIHECKDVACDCKPPAGCTSTHTAAQASRFFELFRSGKETLVLTTEMN